MTVPAPVVEFTDVETQERLKVRINRLVVAGYTGRDSTTVQHHINELAALGIAPPERTPTYYQLPVDRLTQGSQVSASTAATSGEVEPVLVSTTSGWYLTVGSDHTARDLERVSVRASKAACSKPLGTLAVKVDDVAHAWDSMRLRSWADGRAYQDGHLSHLLPPDVILNECPAPRPRSREPGTAIYLGTVPLLDGQFAYATQWRMALTTPRGDLTCHYRVVPFDQAATQKLQEERRKP